MCRIIKEASCMPQFIAFFLDQDATDIDLVLVRPRILCSHFVKTAESRLARLMLLFAGPLNPLVP